MRLHQLATGTLLRCVSVDHADEPHNHEVLVDDLVMVVNQTGKHYGDTTMLCLTSGVFFRCSYTFDCIYDRMEVDACYELYEP